MLFPHFTLHNLLRTSNYHIIDLYDILIVGVIVVASHTHFCFVCRCILSIFQNNERNTLSSHLTKYSILLNQSKPVHVILVKQKKSYNIFFFSNFSWLVDLLMVKLRVSASRVRNNEYWSWIVKTIHDHLLNLTPLF